MLKYVKTEVVFQEIPDEVSVAIWLSLCPNKCPGCHSSFLAGDIGNVLTDEALESIIKNNVGATCILFMGGDNDHKEVARLAGIVHDNGLAAAWYSGDDYLDTQLDLLNFDYIKIGRWDESKGPLTDPNTNQKLYKVYSSREVDSYGNIVPLFEDITYKFWKHNAIN